MGEEKAYVYHKTEEPKVILVKEVEEYKKKGWSDTPASFLDFSKHIDMDNEAAVQAAGQTVQGVVDALNGQLNLEGMTKREMANYAKKHLDLELDLSQSKTQLAGQIKSLLADK